MNFDMKDVAGLEARNIAYSEDGQGNDLMLVKEYVHLKDGRVIPNLRFRKNYMRKFYVAKTGTRNYKEKKQWESKENVIEFKTNQANLAAAAHKALGGFGQHRGLREVFKSPYLYGCGVKPTVLLRNEYQTRFADFVTPRARVMVYDIETDMFKPGNEPIIATITMKEHVHCAIVKSFLGDKEEIDRKLIMDACHRHLSKYIKERNLKIEITFHDNAGDACDYIIRKTHEYSPDFLTAWNMEFDITTTELYLKKYGYDPSVTFSDPSVPRNFKHFKFKPGPKQKETHDGSLMSKANYEQWHKVEAMAGYYIVDAMGVYYQLRFAAGKEEGYGLDSVLGRNLNLSKLKIPEVEGLIGPDWHKKMQKDYKYDYVAYNIFDCIAVELLDEKTNDLATAFPLACGVSNYEDFASNPRQIADDMHFIVEADNHVLGVTLTELNDENDAKVVGVRGWIAILPAHMCDADGVDVIDYMN